MKGTESWELPHGEVLVCACMNVIGAHLGFTPIWEDGLHICKDLPFGLTNFWKRGLGEFALEDINRSDLKIIAHGERRGSRTMNDSDTIHLTNRITCLRIALALLGAKASSYTILRAEYSGDDVWVYSAGPKQNALYQFSGTSHVFCNDDVLAAAVNLEETITRVFSTRGTYARLRRSLNAYYSACEEHEPYERMHMFVRTLDGILKTRQYHGRKDFVQRAQLVTGTAYKQMLNDAYSLRSASAHMGELSRELRKPKRGNELLLFLEILASEALRRVLQNPSLLAAFESDATIDAYWRTNPQWRPRVRVHTIQHQRSETWKRLELDEGT